MPPPFSVIDADKGYWHTRKQEWLSLGLRSGDGRTSDLTFGARLFSDSHPRSYWEQKRTSVFDPVLCEINYSWFCPNGGTILDPFAGGSVRGIVASILGYKYIGIDIAPKQVEANAKQAQRILSALPQHCEPPSWICADSRELNETVTDKVDYIFTCPPYYDLEQYSDNPKDLSNCTNYANFLTEYSHIIQSCQHLLKDNRFASFIIANFRDKTGYYHDFVGDTISAFNPMRLYNDIIYIHCRGTAALRVKKQFPCYRKVVRIHSNMLVFYKGDIKQIKTDFPTIQFKIPDDEEAYTHQKATLVKNG